MVQSHINHKINANHGFSPNYIFMGRHGEGSLLPDVPDINETDSFPVVQLNEIHYPHDKELLKMELMNFEHELEKVRNKVFNISDRLRAERRKKLNARLGVEDIQYESGDYVLFSIKDRFKGRSKVMLHWIGPVEVIEVVGSNLYILRDCTGKTYEVHSQRIRFYSKPQDINMQQVIEEVYLHNRGKYYVHKLHDLVKIDNEYWLKCSWKGLEIDELTLERYSSLKNEIPQMVYEYLLSIKEENQAATLLLQDFSNNI